MTVDWTQVLNNLGFPILFGVFVLWSISKYGPEFLKAWNEFSKAIQNLSRSVDDNTAVTKKQYEESMSVKEQLKQLNEKLNNRDARFDKLDSDYLEIISLLDSIEKKLRARE
jgi:cell shape-determining protein MreC